MASELNVLARDAARVARAEPAHRRFHPQHPAAGAAEIVACFPVYRTYVDGTARRPTPDRRDLDWAVAQARRNEPTSTPACSTSCTGC